MLTKIQKMSVVTVYHLIFLLVSYLVTIEVLEHLFSYSFSNLRWDMLLLLVFSAVYFVLMWKSLYSHSYHYYLKSTTRIVCTCLSISAGVTFSFGFLTELFKNHGFLKEGVLFLSIGTLAYLVLHVLQYLWVRSLSRLGFFKRNVLMVGEADPRLPVEKLFQDVGNTKVNVGRLIYRDGAWIYRRDDSSDTESYCYEIHDLMYRLNVGEVIIFMSQALTDADLVDIVSFCRTNSIGYYLVPDIARLPYRGPWSSSFGYIPVIERFSTPRDSLTLISIKRLLDIVLSLFGILTFLPIGLFIALLIKLEDWGPIFYVSTRIGKNGRPIKFYKFRSMVLDAEKKKAELMKFNERNDGPLFKMKNDPRITPIGRILRKYSLDEVPQLWNVLKGDMSLVGPRPHLPEEVRAYTAHDYLRLECIPGITCLPQIYGRNSLGFREWVDYDLHYRKSWSPMLDLHIIGKTISVVIAPILAGKAEGEGY